MRWPRIVPLALITIGLFLSACDGSRSKQTAFNADLNSSGGWGDGTGTSGGTISMTSLNGIDIRADNLALPTNPGYVVTGSQLIINGNVNLSSLASAYDSMQIDSNASLIIDTSKTLTIAGDVLIRGTIKANFDGPTGNSNGSLTIMATTSVLAPGRIWVDGGTIDNRGDDRISGGGGNAQIITLDADGDVFLDGSITTRGGDGLSEGDGGDGSAVILRSNLGSIYIYNEGAINTRGGHGSRGIAVNGDGGAPGDITLDAPLGQIFIKNVTSVSVEGGQTKGGPTQGGTLSLTVSDPGNIIVGSITIHAVQLLAHGGSMLNQNFTAGNGGTITFTASSIIDISNLSILNANGGKGEVDDGGNGGTITLKTRLDPPGPPSIVNAGTIMSNGGEAKDQGGFGGPISLLSEDALGVGTGNNILLQATSLVHSDGKNGGAGGSIIFGGPLFTQDTTNDGLITSVPGGGSIVFDGNILNPFGIGTEVD